MSREKRKIDHIRHALSHSRELQNHFDDIEVVHQSVSGLSWDGLRLDIKVGELSLSSPLFVNAMTGGGGKKTEDINRQLAEVAAETGIAMAVGSQMSALKNPEEKRSYEVVRKSNPKGNIFANLGSEADLEHANQAVDMLEADALQIHLNTLQELIMPEGDRNFSTRLNNIEKIASRLPVPVIVKEVGYGMSMETAALLKEAGVRYIDVAGRGGTNFSKVENQRRENPLHVFEDWGIPTPVSLLEVQRTNTGAHIFASGGIRHGLDGAKALILGAEMFGMAGGLLKVLVTSGQEALIERIESIHHELKVTMMLLNADEPHALAGKAYILTGKTKEWMDQRSQ
ncbi:isopentenyl-diphosphate delta-isomerase [Thalassobacillus devorans]|uniref:Isopentenyl-diphosphate delta-isomerase n=1 Tax=Thalassobacillus devorans TaxID=279813 RepID=A0ABQ1P1K6_9BACI|nr:type 2 isopentenyl-diphosphate Delta-isomerase [Thalassobacillus devorans]NIK28322.1 isopentenyl-diphosphate delta-isomerase [Thalassobacillus devorans]GGC87193.1 isopentenyl-diphosphate delta-isomerase [Thalassobacillus devorans]